MRERERRGIYIYHRIIFFSGNIRYIKKKHGCKQLRKTEQKKPAVVPADEPTLPFPSSNRNTSNINVLTFIPRNQPPTPKKK